MDTAWLQLQQTRSEMYVIFAFLIFSKVLFSFDLLLFLILSGGLENGKIQLRDGEQFH